MVHSFSSLNSVLDREMVLEARDALGVGYADSVMRFLTDGKKKIDRIKDNLQDCKNWDAIAFDAHTLKSASAFLGAAIFPRHAEELEQTIRQLKGGESINSLALHIINLEKEFEKLQCALLDEIKL